MVINVKYAIGDIVKVITPKGEELILQITELLIRVSSKGICTEYHSEYYTKYNNEYDYDIPCPIVESKEDTNGCPIPYIKCKVEIKEINN